MLILGYGLHTPQDRLQRYGYFATQPNKKYVFFTGSLCPDKKYAKRAEIVWRFQKHLLPLQTISQNQRFRTVKRYPVFLCLKKHYTRLLYVYHRTT